MACTSLRAREPIGRGREVGAGLLLHEKRQPDTIDGGANQPLHIVNDQWTLDIPVPI